MASCTASFSFLTLPSTDIISHIKFLFLDSMDKLTGYANKKKTIKYSISAMVARIWVKLGDYVR